MTIKKSTLQKAFETLRKERYELLQQNNLPEDQAELNELNEACRDILRGIYPVVSMSQIAEKLAKYPQTQLAIQYDTTTRYEVTSIDSVESEVIYFTYNGSQKDSNKREREFFVTHNQGKYITVVPVEYWYCNIY